MPIQGLSSGQIPPGIMKEIDSVYDTRIHSFIEGNKGKYIAKRGAPLGVPMGGAIRLRIDVNDIIQKCGNVRRGMKTLRIMLFNTILETSVELAYNIKNQMRMDTGTMAASWGIFDPIYLKDINSWSKKAREFFHDSPEFTHRMAQTSAVFKIVNENENSKNFRPEIIQGSLIPWLAKNELSLGNALGVKNYISIEYNKARRRLMYALNKEVERFANEMNMSNWRKIPRVQKRRYKQNKSLIKIANELGVRGAESGGKGVRRQISEMQATFKSMFSSGGF